MSICRNKRLRSIIFEADFLVCRIVDDASLVMESLSQQDCLVACDLELLFMVGKALQRTDEISHLLTNKVQVIRTLTLPPDREVQVVYLLNSELSGPMGFIKSLLGADR